MPNYKATRNTHYKIYVAANITEAQQIADQFGSGWIVEETNEPVPTMTGAERVQMGLDFGNKLKVTFLNDNQSSPFYPFTEAQNNALMAKFQSVLSFAQVGSIRQISDMLPSIVTDEIFTQERKDNYIAMCANFLAQF